MSHESFKDRIGKTLSAITSSDMSMTPQGHAQSGSVMSLPPVKVDVRMGGKPVDPSTAFVEQLQTRYAVNELPTATLVLSLSPSPPGDYKALDHVMSLGQVGHPVTLTMATRTVFEGVVGAVKVTAGPEGRKVKITLKNKLQGLKATPRSRILERQQDSALVREVLREHGVRVSGLTLSASGLVQRLQWGCSDWIFLRAVLGLHGAWLWPHTDGSVKVQPPQLGGKTHQIAATVGAKGIVPLEAEWDYSGVNQPEALTTHSWDLRTQSAVTKTAAPQTLGKGGLAPTSVKALGGKGGAVLPGHWEGMLHQTAVNGWFAAHQAQAVRVRLTLSGSLDCQVGDTVALDGFGSHLDGQGIVTQVEHRCDVNGRAGKTVIGVGLDDAAALPPSLPMPSGVLMGQVQAYRDDPNGPTWNRLPVKVPVLGEAILWARMGHVYASKNSGVTFYPEAGDEVVLGFDGDAPVIVAALHNPQRPAAIVPDKTNAKKGMVLRHGGQRVELSFDRDAKVATLALGSEEHPEQTITVDKMKGIGVMSTKGHMRVSLNGGGFNMFTKMNIALLAKEEVYITSLKKMTVNSDKEVLVKVGVPRWDGKVDENGKIVWLRRKETEGAALTLTKKMADLAADRMTVKSTQSATLDGGERLEVKGRTLKLDGEKHVGISGKAVGIKGMTDVHVEAPTVTVTGNTTTEVGGTGTTNVKGLKINLG